MKCCWKLVYTSYEAARAVGKTVVKRGLAKQNRPYYCQRCRGWHLTSMSMKDYKAACLHLANEAL